MNVFQAALKCVYKTVKNTKLHTSDMISVKIINVLQMILEQSADEKLKVLALQTLRELAAGGFHIHLVDIQLFNTLFKFITPQSNPQEDPLTPCLHLCSFEVLQAMISSSCQSTYNFEKLTGSGLVRVVC